MYRAAGSSPFTVMTNIFVIEFNETFRNDSIAKLFSNLEMEYVLMRQMVLIRPSCY